MREFKFFSGTKRVIDWSITGLLEDSANPSQLVRALNVTLQYVDENHFNQDSTCGDLIFLIMARIYRTKFHAYEDYEMRNKVIEIVTYFECEEMRQMMDDISINACYSIDVEAEMCAIVAEKCDWVENL